MPTLEDSSNFVINTMGDIPILEETKPVQVSIYQELKEADDWYNKSVQSINHTGAPQDETVYHSPGYFIIKELTLTISTDYFTGGKTNEVWLSMEGGDQIYYSGVFGFGFSVLLDLTPLFFDSKLVGNNKINMRMSGDGAATATLTLKGFRIRPFDPYKPNSTNLN